MKRLCCMIEFSTKIYFRKKKRQSKKKIFIREKGWQKKIKKLFENEENKICFMLNFCQNALFV